TFLGGDNLRLLATVRVGEREAQADVLARDEEAVRAELRDQRAAERGVLERMRVALDPGPVVLAERPAGELRGDFPAAESGFAVGSVGGLGGAPRRVVAGDRGPVARHWAEQAERRGER